MSKFCVFCGNKPDKKNKEHIIPKWLIRLTGNENRTISLGVNFNHIFKTGEINFENRYFSFKSFQFPACTTCNLSFSSFENKASIVVKRILGDQYINEEEINTLLDWFDKVRIGLWLGSITLDKIEEDVNPKFHINDRIGKKDRALFIYKLSKQSDGVNFHGFNTPGFQFAPCLFGLRINNYFFINYSKEFLFGKNLGFPYFEFLDIDENSRADVYKPKNGSNKITTPIIKNNLLKPSFVFYQAVMDRKQIPNEFLTEYVINRLSKTHLNRSSIFFYNSFEKKIQLLKKDEEIIVDGKTINSQLEIFNKKITKTVLEELENLIKFKHHLKIKNKEKANVIEENRKYVLKTHKTVKQVLYESMK